MSDLVGFLNARLDEDERGAMYWQRHRDGNLQNLTGIAIPSWDFLAQPERVLREVEAKRAILEKHKVNSQAEVYDSIDWHAKRVEYEQVGKPTGKTEYWCWECDEDRDYQYIPHYEEGCPTLRLVAAVYSDHPDYQVKWRVQ